MAGKLTESGGKMAKQSCGELKVSAIDMLMRLSETSTPSGASLLSAKRLDEFTVLVDNFFAAIDNIVDQLVRAPEASAASEATLSRCLSTFGVKCGEAVAEMGYAQEAALKNGLETVRDAMEAAEVVAIRSEKSRVPTPESALEVARGKSI